MRVGNSNGAKSGEGNSVQVLQKGAAILAALAAQDELTVAELSDRIDEPRSSVYRFVATLRELGMVQPGRRRGTFRLGLRLLELGSAVSSRFDERQAALPIMQELGEETSETIFLCVRRAYDAVCIERIDGEHVRSMALRLGGAQPLHAGGAPRALLAWQSKAFLEEYVANPGLTKFTPQTIGSKRDLLKNMSEIQAAGYAISDGDVTPGIAAIGAPIFGHDGRILASISISGTRPLILESRFEERRDAVMGAARRISADLGWRPNAASWWLVDEEQHSAS